MATFDEMRAVGINIDAIKAEFEKGNVTALENGIKEYHTKVKENAKAKEAEETAKLELIKVKASKPQHALTDIAEKVTTTKAFVEAMTELRELMPEGASKAVSFIFNTAVLTDFRVVTPVEDALRILGAKKSRTPKAEGTSVRGKTFEQTGMTLGQLFEMHGTAEEKEAVHAIQVNPTKSSRQKGNEVYQIKTKVKARVA